MKHFIIICAASLILVSCGGSSKQTTEEPTDMRTEVRLSQYTVKGFHLYKAHCANCHQQDGSGLAGLYPPLAKSHYLVADLKRAACIIKNGLSGEITVNGKNYNMAMPGNTELSLLETAEILTFITNSWGNSAGLSGVKDVEKWLMECD